MLGLVFLLDIASFLLCVIMLVRTKELTFFHPATLYLIFHGAVITTRLLALNAGAPTLFDEARFLRSGFMPVTYDEIARATIYADIALFMSTIAFIVAGMVHKNRQLGSKQPQKSQFDTPINKGLFLNIMYVAFVIGVFGIIFVGYLPGTDTRLIDSIAVSEWRDSSWIFITQSWMGVALIGMIYIHGFRRGLVILMILFLGIQLYQGFHRFRFVLPLILLLYIYLKHRGYLWPPRWAISLAIVLAVLFLPAKTIGRMMQAGYPINVIAEETISYIVNLPTKSTSDLVFLDQFAMGLTLIDENGQFYYGTTYLPLLTLPIPRQIWPDKPELAFFMSDISTASRPLSRLGTIVTYLGESYANFGFLGIIFVPYIFSYLIGRLYFTLKDKPIESVSMLLYLMILTTLLQVYRDGLISLVMFTLVNFMPLSVAIGLHFIRWKPYATQPAGVGAAKAEPFVNHISRDRQDDAAPSGTNH